MGMATFKGGIHPYDGKNLSKDKAMKVIMPKGDLVFPLSQHIGAPASPVVAVGDTVLMGQTIAEGTGFISASICSSVSGKVKAIAKHLVASGNMVESIIIENDGEYKAVEGYGIKRDYTKMTKEEIRASVKSAGIIGMGGAGFPTHVKLTPKDDNAIDYVIINGAECEPYLTSDYRMMLEYPNEIVTGLKIVLSLFPNAKGIIAVEANKPEAIQAMQQAVENESNISVKVLKTKYPQGAERKLVYATCGRKLNSSLLPADVGCVVNNIDTIYAIYQAVCENIPSIRRVITVTGDAIAEPGNFIVKTGTSYKELVEVAGGFTEEPEKVIAGGPMMGMALYDIDVPVTKASSALLAMKMDPVAEVEQSNCIKCGRCVTVCPCQLVPAMMAKAVKQEDLDKFISLQGMECYECGCCTYACPAKIPLTQYFKKARKAVIASRKKAK